MGLTESEGYHHVSFASFVERSQEALITGPNVGCVWRACVWLYPYIDGLPSVEEASMLVAQEQQPYPRLACSPRTPVSLVSLALSSRPRLGHPKS